MANAIVSLQLQDNKKAHRVHEAALPKCVTLIEAQLQGEDVQIHTSQATGGYVDELLPFCTTHRQALLREKIYNALDEFLPEP